MRNCVNLKQVEGKEELLWHQLWFQLEEEQEQVGADLHPTINTFFWLLFIFVCHKSLKWMFKTSYKITVWICGLMLWIQKSFFVVKMLVWNIRIKDFWYTKVLKNYLVCSTMIIQRIVLQYTSKQRNTFHDLIYKSYSRLFRPLILVNIIYLSMRLTINNSINECYIKTIG